jgi:flagellar motor switch protein FliM
VIDLRPRLGNIETNPQFAQIVPPSDMVVLITLETKVGDVEGMTNFCIPYLTIEPIISKLSAQYWYSSIRKGGTTENLAILKKRLDSVFVSLVAELGGLEISVRDVLNLQKGDFIKLTHTKVDDEMELKIGRIRKYYARPGVVGNHLAVQITRRLETAIDEYQMFKEIEGGE